MSDNHNGNDRRTFVRELATLAGLVLVYVATLYALAAWWPR
jgi:hypothetical protein